MDVGLIRMVVDMADEPRTPAAAADPPNSLWYYWTDEPDPQAAAVVAPTVLEGLAMLVGRFAGGDEVMAHAMGIRVPLDSPKVVLVRGRDPG